MRRTIRDLLADPDHATAMGRRGRDFAEAHADVRVYAAKIAEVVRWHLDAAGRGRDVATEVAPS